MRDFLLAFIPLFVAVDAIGVLPIFSSLTEGVKKSERYKIIMQSMVTAIGLATGFIFLGKVTFKLLNITLSDFMIAGGVILFSIAILDILNPGKKRRIPSNQLGAVPLGTPLIAGPAVLTTSLILLEGFGIKVTLLSVVSNIMLAGAIFSFSDIFIRFLGVSGSRALSKIMSLFLAAIAVMMIRKGLMQFF